jgi:hypothetical protein
MTTQLNHTIVHSSDRAKSARFLAEILGRPAPVRFGPFEVVDLGGRGVYFPDPDGHYLEVITRPYGSGSS